MKIRGGRKLKSLNLLFRIARIEDAEILHLIEQEYLNEIDRPEFQRSIKNFRMKIGSGLLHGEGITIVEDREDVIGFIEHKKHSSSAAKISFPFVEYFHKEKYEIQKELIKNVLDKFKRSKIKFVFTEFFDGQEESVKLFTDFRFSEPLSIFQAWDGEILPDPTIDMNEYKIRRMLKSDFEISYSWIIPQLNKFSPLYITKETFKSLLNVSKHMKEGWAMVTLEEKPVCFVSSLIDQNEKSVVIFGPFCDKSHVQARIPLMNELFLFYKLQGLETARILRIDKIHNDEELFGIFGFTKSEQINLMTRRL